MRRTTSVAAAVVLAAGAVVVPSSAAQPPDRAAVRTVTREYGGPGVQAQGPRERVRVRFEGEAGDRVDLVADRLCRGDRVMLHRDGRRIGRGPDRLFRLPRTGSYTLGWKPCASSTDAPRLQLTKYVVTRLRVDGPALPVRTPRRGFARLGRVRVPADGFVGVEVTVPYRLVLRDGSAIAPRSGINLEAGRPIHFWDRSREDSRDLRAGEPLLLVPRQSRGTFEAFAGTVSPVTVDGAGVELIVDEQRGRDTILELMGQAGQWVHVESPPQPFSYFGLYGPDGQLVVGPGYGNSWWQLPTTGRYRLFPFFCCEPQLPLATTARVRSIREVAAMPTDGTPVVFTAQAPGEWILAPLTKTSPALALRVIDFSSSSWAAKATYVPSICGTRSATDCPVGSSLAVSPTTPVASTPDVVSTARLGPWQLVVQFAPGQTGSVTLAMTQ